MKLSVKYSKLNPVFILEMLQQGCKIQFPTGYYIAGEVSEGHIQVGHSASRKDGLWELNLDGVKEAIKDAKEYERAMKA